MISVSVLKALKTSPIIGMSMINRKTLRIM